MSASAAYLRKLEKQRGSSITSSASTSNSNAESKKGVKGKHCWKPTTKAILNGFINKYQNRRSQLLKSVNPYRSPVNVSRIQLRQNVWVNQQRLTINDIVSIVDSNDGKKYFGQIHSLLTDSYAKHYVFVVWLVPNQPEPCADKFCAHRFVHGVADERPIPAECCEFEQSCPLLPRYMRTFGSVQVMQEQIRSELVERQRTLRKEAYADLANIRDDFKNTV